MTKFQKTIVTAIATGSMLLNVTAAFAQTTSLIISGNGTDSDNTVSLSKTNTTSVAQTNVTNVDNNVNVTSKTGGNTAEGNVGGGVEVKTGDSNVDVKVTNQLNSNVADVKACGSCQGDLTAIVADNGSKSDNTLNLGVNDKVAYTDLIKQDNVANVDNHVNVNADTGKNNVEDTTGGANKITTGDSTVTSEVTTTANANTAVIEGSTTGGDVTAAIMGNGTESDNSIGLALNNQKWIDQSNLTSIDNRMDIHSKTGDNSIDDSTGGVVEIQSGDSDVTAKVDNMAGFNAADLSCCNVGDILAKVGGNGNESESTITAALDNTQGVTQANACGSYALTFDFLRPGSPCFDNHLSLDGYTGDNSAEDNTGAVNGDPKITTGDSSSDVTVTNNGGSNVFGHVTLPTWTNPTGTGLNFSFSFSLSDLLGLLHQA